MKNVMLACLLLAGYALAEAQNPNATLSQGGESKTANNNRNVAKTRPSTGGYRVNFNTDSVTIVDKDFRVVYTCPVADTSYMAVVRNLRETGTLVIRKE